MITISIINGPNLNFLGKREPSVYGDMTLNTLEDKLITHGQQIEVNVKTFQSNSESEIIEHIYHCSDENVSYIVINPAAFTHTSIAIRDALLAVNIPFIEVHISNLHKREAFRQQSYFSDIATGVVTGLGLKGYQLALDAIASDFNLIASNNKP